MMASNSVLIGLVLTAIVGGLGGCSRPKPDEHAATSVSGEADPPGVAQALSLGGGGRLEGNSDLENALNCAVALKGTTIAVAALRGDDSEEVRALGEVQRIYRTRAAAIAEIAGESESFAAREIDKRSLANFAPEQAQLAMACLNALQPAQG
jgi:hypothetical protein